MVDTVNLGRDIPSPVLPQSGYFILGINCRNRTHQCEMIFMEVSPEHYSLKYCFQANKKLFFNFPSAKFSFVKIYANVLLMSGKPEDRRVQAIFLKN